jgi:two-component system, chemotaxis family, sensor kinase CheA
MSDSFDRKEFVAGYLVEVEEHLQAANANLLAVEAGLPRNEPHARRVRELFRALHTLKGLSAMVGVDPVVDLAHEMEVVLRSADRSTGKLSLAAVELLLKGLHAIELRVRAFAEGKVVPTAPPELLQALANLEPGPSRPPSDVHAPQIALDAALLAKLSVVEQDQIIQGASGGRRALRVEFFPSPAHSVNGITITTVRERVSKVAEIVKVLPRAVAKSDAAPGGLAFTLLLLSDVADDQIAEAASVNLDALALLVPAGGDEASEALPLPPVELEPGLDQPLQTSSIRVDVARLDDALEKLSALVVTRFRVARALATLREQGADVRELASIVSENARQLRDLRACITRARMVSVRELLERVPLIVRGMSRSTGKRVRLSIEAGKAELDKSVAERIFPAIVHLVRNAIDHAIETPDERRRLGKPEEGVVTVSCFEHSNTELELHVADDGRGLDAKLIASKAGRPVPADDKGLLELITLPGLSTVDQPTASSGRGMGMEIVKRITVDTLGGNLALHTAPGLGTTFSLCIPLSISILDCLSFVCGEQIFVVPVAVVEEIVELDPLRTYESPAPSGGHVRLIERRGESIPLLSLADVLAAGASAPVASKALIVRRQGETFAFGVERMIGQQEVVVRPLEDPLVKVTGVSGATDLGDGKPTLVLDLPGLVARVSARKGIAA